MARQKAKLSNVKLDEISFVGKGDNPEAHIMLLKIKKDPTESSMSKADKDVVDETLLKAWMEDNASLLIKEDGEAVTFAEIQADKDLRDKVWQMCYTLEDSLSSIVHDDSVTDKTAMISQSIDQFKAAITAITKGEKIMTPEEIAALKKEKDEAIAKVEILTKENDTLKACAADDKKKIDELAAVGKVKKDDEDILKGLPESIQKELKANREAITKMQDNELTREFVAKAADVALVGEADVVGDLLKSIAKHDSALADKVLGIFKTADARIKEGDLLKELGKNTEETTAGDTAYAKIVAKAAELRKASPELSDAQAFTKVYDSDTELRTAYLNERN